MTQDRRLTPLVASLPATVPFVGPETQERTRGAPFAARLGANESGFGPAPAAITAMQQAATEVWKYGDPEAHDLRTALADHLGIKPAHIILGEGIDGLLGLLVRMILAPGDTAVTSTGAYPTFNYHVAGFGARIEAVPYTGDATDPMALIARAGQTNAKLIYLANPDNPMGGHHNAATIVAMVEALPEGCLLILDEAYVEFAPEAEVPPLDPTDPRLIRMRTFSKAYGMAGARVGYGIGPAPLIAAFDRVRNHFGLNRIAQAGALASLSDPDWLPHIRNEVATARARIGQIAADNGLTPLPSATNFVTLDCGQDGDFARAVLAELLKRGIFVRMPFVAPQDRCIRVGCGPEAELSAFEAALPAALDAARAEN